VPPVTEPTPTPTPPTSTGPSLGADGWPTITPEPYNPYLDEAAPAPGPAPRPAPVQPGGGLADVLGNPAVTSFMRSLGSSLGGSLGRSIFGTRKRRR